VQVGGRASSLAELGEVTAKLLSLTTQGSIPGLASGAGVLAALDARAGAGALVREVGERVAEFRRLRAELAALVERAGRAGASRDDLVKLAAELETLAPELGEHTALMRRVEVLSRAQHYLELLASVSGALSEREEPIERELSRLLQSVRRAPARDSFAGLEAELAAALTAVSAAAREAERVASDLDCEPMALEHAERRLEAMARLANRLGCPPDALAENRKLLETQLAELESFASRRAELESAVSEAENAAEALAEELHAARARRAPELEKQLRTELAALALDAADVRVIVERTPSAELGGGSRLELLFSANPAIAPEPLTRIASGGERARFALALCCLGAARGLTVVLDEIDQGVGGEAVEAMAERLQRLGRTQQIICVTHKAAIAARADAHFRVQKSIADGRTRVRIEQLDDKQRTQEVSRMLAGGSAPSASRALARRLLEAARRAA
jgi:DNA repair protein RecN (Recombination protein N)